MAKEENLSENDVINKEQVRIKYPCYLCGEKITTPLMVYTTNKSRKFSHLSCKLKQIENELFAYNKRIPLINLIKKRILKYPKEIEEEIKLLNKQNIIKALE